MLATFVADILTDIDFSTLCMWTYVAKKLHRRQSLFKITFVEEFLFPLREHNCFREVNLIFSGFRLGPCCIVDDVAILLVNNTLSTF